MVVIFLKILPDLKKLMNSLLQQANLAMRSGDYARSLDLYARVLDENPGLKKILTANIQIASDRYHNSKISLHQLPSGKTEKNIVVVIFISPVNLDSPVGYQIQLHAQALIANNIHCLVAVPDAVYGSEDQYVSWIPKLSPYFEVVSYSKLLEHSLYHLSAKSNGAAVIHAWSNDLPVIELISKIRFAKDTPLIGHLGKPEDESVGSETKDWRKVRDMLSATAKRMFPNVNGVTFSFSGDEIEEESDVLNIAPQVDERLFYPRPRNAKVRADLGISDSQCLVVYPESYLNASKDVFSKVQEAIDILDRQGKQIVLVGFGKAEYSFIDKNNSATFIKQLGWLQRKKIPEILAAADILYFPGSENVTAEGGVSATLAEFFAMGRPVVMPHLFIGGKGDLEHKKNAWLLVPDSEATALAAAWDQLSTNKKLAQRLSIEAMFFYRENLATESSGQLLSFYQHTLAKYHSEQIGGR